MPATPPKMNARSRLGEIGRDIGNDPLIFLSLLSAPIGKLPIPGIGGVFVVMYLWFDRFKSDFGQSYNQNFDNAIYSNWQLWISLLVSLVVVGLSAYATWGKKDKPNALMLILVLALFLPAVFIGPWQLGLAVTVVIILVLAVVWQLIMRHLPSTVAIFIPLLIMLFVLFGLAFFFSWLGTASATGGNLNPGYDRTEATRVYKEQQAQMTPTAAAMQTAWCAENCGPLAATETASAARFIKTPIPSKTPKAQQSPPKPTPTKSK